MCNELFYYQDPYLNLKPKILNLKPKILNLKPKI